uniref:Uncharacterized protein n=1 Tax=Marseillevirus LCMAC202 TaxID=2506606 RepID=A0A481YYL7_9VIRU|nr:MAG: hypothetical protein LCMAC202_06400 [Marseillevirus LCMAC202]
MTAEQYIVHDNGSRPFMVVRNGSTVDVYLTEFDKSTNTTNHGNLIGHYTNVTQFFDGQDPTLHIDGNSILFKHAEHARHHDYTFVGCEIYQFATKERINEYVSPMGNSDVPYPYAITDTRTYLMIEDVYLKNNEMLRKTSTVKEYTNESDPYSQYYGHTVAKRDRPKGHLFRKTVRHAKRLYTEECGNCGKQQIFYVVLRHHIGTICQRGS